MTAKKRTIIALGADIKNRFLLAEGKKLFFGPVISDLSDAASYDSFRKEIWKLVRRARPDVIAHDLHPGYFSTLFAKELSSGLSAALYAVQHHHAHAASAMFEHGLRGPVIGVSFDGTGYGTDGNIWGGEFLLVHGRKFDRLAHLKMRMMPGGDKAISEPWRMALSVLGAKGAALLGRHVPENDKKRVLRMMKKGVNSPLTSSAARLFDAASALLGLCRYASREAEAPLKLERAARSDIRSSYDFGIIDGKDGWVIDTDGLFLGILRDMKRIKDRGIIAAKFHNSVRRIITETAGRLSRKTGTRNVVLSGGVFQNNFLRTRTVNNLTRLGLNVFSNERTPVNDLNIALGQYYVLSGAGKS